ncbi:cytoplasmic incompatibility factor CifB [Wolbachia endosymbiont (group B) of Rhopobota naevana]|uniref:cytoplasmic incompatibility factor CifB n=1 Tax=Wolbachia endosymbiont (group B) of Rhopobota naevana TaxID=2954054 RepID=UPI0029D417D2|nr:cytoplasmic incompatibility factor CifB [Wolbachia endosymbiont (group B) of Rhopobota naevana]
MSLIRSLVDGDLDGFRQEFESFLDQCPFFLYHVSTGRFLPVFFFSMFATAHDANILKANERVYFRFDNHGIDTGGRNRNTGNLKVAVYRDGQQVVRCYSISDRPNSDGLRFSTRERNALVREIRRQNPNLRAEDLNFEQYKVCMHGKGKSQGEAVATVFEVIREKDSQGRDRFAKYSASEISLLRHIERNRLNGINAPEPRSLLTVKEIGSIRLNQDQRVQLGHLVNFVQVAPGQQGIFSFMEVLASNQRINIERGINEGILPYITRIYRNYLGSIQNDIQNRDQKFESHGFFLGLLANFSHLYKIDIDLDLSPGNSYIAFLVRHQAERENIPIVINVTRWRTSSDIALDRARGDAKRLHASSFISIHTESRNAVCIGLNFNLNIDPFSVDTVGLQQGRFPLVQRLFDCLENEGIRENIKDFLLRHLPNEISRNADNYNRILDYITGFAFGSSAFDHEQVLIQNNRLQVAKYIFRYDDENHALTMVFHAQGSDIVILDIRAHGAQQQGDIDLQTLNVNGDNVHVWEVSCTLNDQFELYIDQPNDLGLYHDYQNNNANNFLDGVLVQVPNAENVHNALNQVMNDGWQNRDQHRVLLMAISRVLMPENMNGDAIIDVDSNEKFRSMLHGVFYASGDPGKVLTGYTVGQAYSSDVRMEEGRVEEVRTRVTKQTLDLLLLREPIENDSDTHPIGYVLGFANDQRVVAQQQSNAKRQIGKLMGKERGYLPVTSGNKVVLSYAVFNRGAQRAEDLISTRQPYVHKLDRRGRDLRPIEHEGIIDESPPANLLSDVTIQNLRNYRQNARQEDQRKEKILFFQQGDNYNQCIEVRLHECSKENAIRKRIRSIAYGTIPTTQTVQDVLTQIRGILNNQQIEVSDLLTLEFATSTGYYDYWLQQIDIARAARLRYQLRTEGNRAFEVVNLARDNQQMVQALNQFRENAERQRLTLIITLNNTHWITLVIERQNENNASLASTNLSHTVIEV